jgi:Tol biopolymer transport system component
MEESNSVGALTVAIALVSVVSISILTRSTPQPPTRLAIAVSPTEPLHASGDNELAISSDGRRIVYQGPGGAGLYLRSLDQLVTVPISGTENGGLPVFSPDGNSVAFIANGKLMKVPISGGPPVSLSDSPGLGISLSWGADGTIVFSAENSLFRVSSAGGERELLATPQPQIGEGGYGNPHILPGGEDVLFQIYRAGELPQIAVLSLKTGEKKVLSEEGSQPRYAPTGHLVYGKAETLMAVVFDLSRTETIGESVPLVQSLRADGTSGPVDWALSDNGTLVYVPSSVRGADRRNLVWVDRQGRPEALLERDRGFSNPSLSPDGLQLAVSIRDPGSQNAWIYEMESTVLTPITFEANEVRSPVWTVDGKSLAFGVGLIGILRMSVESGETEHLTESKSLQLPNSWSPNGELAYTENLPLQGDIWVLPSENGSQPREFLVTEFNERHPMFSPNGQWIALSSDRSGQDEVYVTPFPGPGRMIQVSNNGGSQPQWAHSGQELFYRNGDKMMAVSVVTEGAFKALEIPRLLFEGSYVSVPFDWASNYDVSPDGERFVMVTVNEQVAPAQINVILNWFEELNRLVPTDN